MGKKTDIRNILNNKKIENNSWSVKYVEKKTNEFGLYLYLHLEIKEFIQKFLKSNELKLYKYNINFLESELKISISYFKSSNIKKLVYKPFRLKKTIKFVKNCSIEKLVKLEKLLKNSLSKYYRYKKFSGNEKESLKLLYDFNKIKINEFFFNCSMYVIKSKRILSIHNIQVFL